MITRERKYRDSVAAGEWSAAMLFQSTASKAHTVQANISVHLNTTDCLRVITSFTLKVSSGVCSEDEQAL